MTIDVDGPDPKQILKHYRRQHLRLHAISEAIRVLLADESFQAILRSEGLQEMTLDFLQGSRSEQGAR